jgi:capsular polysaccharide transport system permease protein
VISVTLSFVVAVSVLMALGLMDGPAQLHLVYAGWFVLAWLSFGLSMILGALAEVFEYVERFVQLFTYILVPLSGTFYMVSWLPPQFRGTVLYIPFIHCIEMIRAGFFGEFTPTFFTFRYPMAWAACLTLAGLFLLRFVRERIDVE